MTPHANPIEPELPTLTAHSRRRMAQRGIRRGDVATTLRHGRKVHVRGARIHVIGRREVKRAERVGANLRDLEGTHVVCTPAGTVLTVYKNKKLDLRDRW